MRARDLKFYDFLNNVKTNLVKWFFCQEDNFAATGIKQKLDKKKAHCFLKPKIIKKKKKN